MLDSTSIFPIWPVPIWPEQSRANYNSKQIEIEFFWPLTEQIPLDLSFTRCTKQETYYKITDPTYGSVIGSESLGYTFANSSTNTSITTNNLMLDISQIVVKTTGRPPLFRRWLYKLLNVKWEIKQ